MEGNSLCGGSQTGWAERKNLFDHLSGQGIKIRTTTMIVLFSFRRRFGDAVSRIGNGRI